MNRANLRCNRSNGGNRQRFADDAQLLGSWISASRVPGRSSGAGTDGEVLRRQSDASWRFVIDNPWGTE